MSNTPTLIGDEQTLTALDLDRLYAPPTEMIRRAVLTHIAPFHEAYLAVATFFCLASGRDQGLDASPRGGAPGFVKVLDRRHLTFADWPGNNRIETLRNLVQDDRLAMLFLFPGLDVFLRVNGRGRISTEAGLLNQLREGARVPKTGIVVAVDQVLFHCGKAIHRAGLWRPEAHIDHSRVPSVGQMKAMLAGGSESDAAIADSHYVSSVQRDLYQEASPDRQETQGR